MYKRTHTAQFEKEEQQRIAERRRKAEAKAQNERMRILDQEREQFRQRKKVEMEMERKRARQRDYEMQWTAILGANRHRSDLHFADIPWPIFRELEDVSNPQLEENEVSNFILFDLPAPEDRKRCIRAALLLYHEDKFESRVAARLKEGERDKARATAQRVTVILNSLMQIAS
jgi:hypothetical protein